MKQKIFIISLLLTLTTVYAHQESAYSYRELNTGISPYLWAPSYWSITSIIALSTNIGISSGCYVTHYAEVQLSRLWIPEFKIAFFSDERVLARISLRNYFHVCRFFHACQGYTFWNYSKYQIAEHNLFQTFQFRLPIKDIFLFVISCGGNMKFIDYDIRNFRTSYKNNYDLKLSPIMKLETHFFITRFYHLGIEISNLFDNDLISTGRFQFEILNDFYPQNSTWNLKLNAGIAFSGSGALAGYPNQFWIALGGSYVHLIAR